MKPILARVAESPKNIPAAFATMGDKLIAKGGKDGEAIYSRITKAFRVKHPSKASMKPSDIRECLLDLWDAFAALPDNKIAETLEAQLVESIAIANGVAK